MPDAKKPRATDLVLFAGLAFLCALVVLKFGGAGVSVPDYVGKPMPPLLVEGWINRPEGQSIDAGGRVLVLDCWASWCGPCLAELPRLAKIAGGYQPLGVRFVGVTSETEAELDAVERVIRGVEGFDWPVGYGGSHLFDALGVGGIPTVFVFGADGRCRWVGNSTDGLAEEIDKALVAAERLGGRSSRGAER